MATIEELNKDYSKENNILKKLTSPGGLKDKITQFQADLDLAVKDFKEKKKKKEYALSRNDRATADMLEKDLETIRKNVLDLRDKIQKASDFLANQQKIVDEKFEELSKDPEIKQKLDSILYKKYDRKKKAELNKKQQLETIKQIVDAHPNIQKWLKGIEGYEKSIRKCDKIIDKYKATPPSTPEEQKDLSDAIDEKNHSTKSLADRRSDLVDYFAKNHPEIDKNILENIHSYGNIDRQIAGCEKSINNYDKAMDNLSVAKDTNVVNQTSPSSLAPVPAQKPSWFHPIQRLKYSINEWRARRTQNIEPNPIEPNASAKSTFLEDVKLSKDEYNSEIVQKYLNEQYQENLHKVARQKGNDSNERGE